MKRKICGTLLAVAVVLTSVNFPAAANAEDNSSAPGVAVAVTGGSEENTEQKDGPQTIHVSAANSCGEDAVLRTYLENAEDASADTETEALDLNDAMKDAITLADGTTAALDAQWVEQTDDGGNVTARYLEAALPAGAAADFDMQLMYRTDEENYTRTSLVKAKAFVDDQDVTRASENEDEDNEAEVKWETMQNADESGNGGDSEAIESAAPASKSAATKSATVPQTAQNYAGARAVSAPADESITSMYNVPVTYYDYLDDQELFSSWRNIKDYGNNQSDGWSVFGEFNRALAQYYKEHNMQTPGLYFGNLLRSASSSPGTDRAAEVNEQIKSLTEILGNEGLYWDNVNNSNYLGGMNKSAQGLVLNTLDADGDLQIASGIDAPWFSEDFLEQTTNGHSQSLGKAFSSRFPFRTVTDSNGINYYEFDSNQGRDNVRYNDNGTFSYGAGTGYGVTDNVTNDWGLDTDSENGGYGFFPFNYKNNGSNNGWLDFGFGAKVEIRFNLPKGGVLTGSGGNEVPVTFEFTGDDDVWVFIDGKLVLDMGGAHKKANGKIDFQSLAAQVTTGGVTINQGAEYNAVSLKEALDVNSSAELTPNQGHTMTIFYMERGMIESNLKIRFNMQPLEHELIVEKDVEVDDVNEGLRETVENADEFDVALSVDGTPASGKTYQKNDGSTGNTEYGLTADGDGSFSLKDGDQAVFKKQFDADIGKTISASESGGSSYLQYDTEWKAVDLENNNANLGQGTGKDASFTYKKTAGDEFTPVRSKLTYVNTPQVGSVSVEKKTVDEGGDPYTDTSTDFQFRIVLDMGITTEGQEVSEVVSDPDSIYVRKPDSWSTIWAYCWNNNTNNGNFPGVKLTEADRVDGFANTYKLENVRDKYDYVIFSTGSNATQTSNLTITSSSSDQEMRENYYTEAGGWANKSQFLEYKTTYVPGDEIGFAGYRLAYQVDGSYNTLYTASDGSFTLKSGEKAVFTGIPAGTGFKIQEVPADGYTVKDVTIGGVQATADAEGDYAGYYSGTEAIQNGQETAVVVTNEKAQVSLNLKAHKRVDSGEGTLSTGEFLFEMSGKASTTLGDGTVTKDSSDYKSQITNDGNGVVVFETLSYQEEGVYLYTIKEIDGDNNKYQYDKSEYEVRVTVQADGSKMTCEAVVIKVKDRNGQALTPPVPVTDIENEIVFDNITNTSIMTVQKQLVKENGNPLPRTSWPNQTTSFAFTFRLEVWDEAVDQYKPCGNQTYYFDGERRTIQSDGTFYLQPQDSADGAKAEFRDLVIGTKYRITEILTSMSEYEFKNAEVNGTEVDAVTSGREYAVETVIQKDGKAVVFKNYPLNSITIIKQDENETPLEGAEFKLERLEGDTWAPYGGQNAVSKSDGKAYFENLHAGKYRITEVKTLPGYVLLKEPIEIELPYEYTAGSIVNGAEVNSAGTAYNITFTVINGQAFDLPQSGYKGVGPMAAAGMAFMVTAGAVFAARNIKRRKYASNRRKRRPH